MSALFIALGVSIAVYIVVMILVPRAAPQDPTANIKNALDRLYEENRAADNHQANLLRDQLNEENSLIRNVFGLPFMQPLYEAGLAAGYQRDLQKLLVIMLGLMVGIVVLITFVGQPLLLALPIAVLLGYMLTLRHCKGRVQKRNRQFMDQFPDALDMIVRSVRSGFPLSTSLQMLAENAEQPVRDEFRKVVDDIALGRTLSQALGRLALRIKESDVRFFVVVLTVQQETGGNLSEIIGNLSNVIRKRKQLRHKIKAMTSEGKATGWIMGALPVVVFGILYFLQPGYLEPLFTEPMGHTILYIVAGLMGSCFFIVRSMINIDI